MEKEPMGGGPRVRVVLVTVDGEDAGRILARRLVQERLVACGNVIPGLTSVYRWDGAIQEETEALVLLKTTEDQVEALRKRVVELHSYEVPEFLSLPVMEGHDRYLRWVAGEVEKPGKAE